AAQAAVARDEHRGHAAAPERADPSPAQHRTAQGPDPIAGDPGRAVHDHRRLRDAERARGRPATRRERHPHPELRARPEVRVGRVPRRGSRRARRARLPDPDRARCVSRMADRPPHAAAAHRLSHATARRRFRTVTTLSAAPIPTAIAIQIQDGHAVPAPIASAAGGVGFAARDVGPDVTAEAWAGKPIRTRNVRNWWTMMALSEPMARWPTFHQPESSLLPYLSMVWPEGM